MAELTDTRNDLLPLSVDIDQLHKPAPLKVRITKEPFMDWIELHLEDGGHEELAPEEARTWFKERGANMETVEKALDYCWNFYKAVVVINAPVQPKRKLS